MVMAGPRSCAWESGNPTTAPNSAMASVRCMASVRFRVHGQLEIDAAIIVLFRSGSQVEIRERDLRAMSRGQVVEHRADNRVVLNFKLVAVFEYQHGPGLIGNRSRVGRDATPGSDSAFGSAGSARRCSE